MFDVESVFCVLTVHTGALFTAGYAILVTKAILFSTMRFRTSAC
jgi:hypothetical protein